MLEERYTSGDYLKNNPSWHVEESPWKAEQVLKMMKQNRIAPKVVCDVGCGVGEVLSQLQLRMDDTCMFWGYDISAHPLELAKSRANDRLHFVQADIRRENTCFFDLILVLDVIEHLEDYISFLREIKPKSQYKIFHIPLDLSAQTVLRPGGLLGVREAYGHLHYFTVEIALQVLRDVDYEILDYCYTARAIEQPTHELRRKLLKLPRKLLFAIHQDLAAHLLGGWSLLVLAK